MEHDECVWNRGDKSCSYNQQGQDTFYGTHIFFVIFLVSFHVAPKL